MIVKLNYFKEIFWVSVYNINSGCLTLKFTCILTMQVIHRGTTVSSNFKKDFSKFFYDLKYIW